MKEIKTRGLRIFAVLIVLATLSGQAHSAAPQFGPPKDLIIGSWIETNVTVPGGPVKSIGVYNADGTFTFTDSGTVRTNTVPQLLFGPSVGVWSHLRDRTFAFSGHGLVSDLEGNFLGTFKFRGETTVDSTGNRYTWHNRFEFSDKDGNLLFSGEGQGEGQRIQLERL